MAEGTDLTIESGTMGTGASVHARAAPTNMAGVVHVYGVVRTWYGYGYMVGGYRV